MIVIFEFGQGLYRGCSNHELPIVARVDLVLCVCEHQVLPFIEWWVGKKTEVIRSPLKVLETWDFAFIVGRFFEVNETWVVEGRLTEVNGVENRTWWVSILVVSGQLTWLDGLIKGCLYYSSLTPFGLKSRLVGDILIFVVVIMHIISTRSVLDLPLPRCQWTCLAFLLCIMFVLKVHILTQFAHINLCVLYLMVARLEFPACIWPRGCSRWDRDSQATPSFPHRRHRPIRKPSAPFCGVGLWSWIDGWPLLRSGYFWIRYFSRFWKPLWKFVYFLGVTRKGAEWSTSQVCLQTTEAVYVYASFNCSNSLAKSDLQITI